MSGGRTGSRKPKKNSTSQGVASILILQVVCTSCGYCHHVKGSVCPEQPHLQEWLLSPWLPLRGSPGPRLRCCCLCSSVSSALQGEEMREVEGCPWLIPHRLRQDSEPKKTDMKHNCWRGMEKSSRCRRRQRFPENDTSSSGNKTKNWPMGSHERKGFCSAKKTLTRTKGASL